MNRIRLELARTPEFPTGNPNHGYEFVASFDDSDHIDAEAWRKQREGCTVRRIEPGRNEELGHLIHTKGRRWAFHYEKNSEFAEDEPAFRFDSHVFRRGEYVSITEHDGVTRPFKVIWVR